MKIFFKSLGVGEKETYNLLQFVNRKLSQNVKERCDSTIAELDIENAINLLKLIKYTYEDGIINEHYTIHWYIIKSEQTSHAIYIYFVLHDTESGETADVK